ncbi:hypothetical protein [Rummeliibacillus stabekisii]|uniref:hypothetical protein n=1 Tax=Rummeliibacillus stabekisii TaxID=241244 RepID=UPI00116F4510|nr:hypothetical protein [Rummeliibacillus stabekisii]MBB5171603.1 hypothetical protein [Rummeliibacillus stabekisii]GEL05450.1 hypothetical protein RST01_20770 [Rummeliibacillus stabekisii]
MENAFLELVNKFGNGSVLTLIIVIVVKLGIKPIFDIFLDVYKERKKRILQSQLEKEKSILQSQLEMENNLKSNSLEFDKYKKDIVLPILQSIANMLEQNIQIIQDYNTVLLT